MLFKWKGNPISLACSALFVMVKATYTDAINNRMRGFLKDFTIT